MREDPQQSSNGRCGRATDRVPGTLAGALGAERTGSISAFGQQVDHVVGNVSKARHAVIDDVRIHELPALVDQLLVQRRAETHHRRARVLAMNERGIDRESDVAHRCQLDDVHLTGFAVDRELETCAADLVEGRHLREALRAPHRSVPEDLTARAEPLLDDLPVAEVTAAVDVGYAPASDADTPSPIERPMLVPGHSRDDARQRRSSLRSASSGRLPGMNSSPGPTRLRSRSSTGSMPSFAAASSICSSPAMFPCGAPNPRNELEGTVLVNTERATTRSAGMR